VAGEARAGIFGGDAANAGNKNEPVAKQEFLNRKDRLRIDLPILQSRDRTGSRTCKSESSTVFAGLATFTQLRPAALAA
jgi:hypothetical protein